MINQIVINSKVCLNYEEIQIAMLCIWGIGEQPSNDITGFDAERIKRIKKVLRHKLNGFSSSNMAFHALQSGFTINGTVNGEDIFSNAQKHKIILVDSNIQFAYPPR